MDVLNTSTTYAAAAQIAQKQINFEVPQFRRWHAKYKYCVGRLLLCRDIARNTVLAAPSQPPKLETESKCGCKALKLCTRTFVGARWALCVAR